nr:MULTISPECIES: DUF4123 domain-containing protein [Pseudomonas]
MATAANLGHVDALVDQTNCELPILPGLRAMQPAMPWFSLFTGLPEEALLEQAPLLMRISLADWRHKNWLGELVEHLAPQSRLLLLLSPLPFDSLTETLQGLSQLEWGGLTGLLRYYDPRVFPHLLSQVLSDEQNKQFLRVALFWSWLDLDLQPTWQPGTYHSDTPLPELQPPIVLTDEQYFRLGGIGDAHQVMEVATEHMSNSTKEERFGACYRLILKAAEENYFGELDGYARQHFMLMARS